MNQATCQVLSTCIFGALVGCAPTTTPDAGQPDPAPVDAGPVDAGFDAGPQDAGFDAGFDAGVLDAGFDGGFDAGEIVDAAVASLPVVHSFDMHMTWPNRDVEFSVPNECDVVELTTRYDVAMPDSLVSIHFGCLEAAGTFDVKRIAFALLATEDDAGTFAGETGTFNFTDESLRRFSVFGTHGMGAVNEFEVSSSSGRTSGTLTIDVWDIAARRVSGSCNLDLTSDDDVMAHLSGSFDVTYDYQ